MCFYGFARNRIFPVLAGKFLFMILWKSSFYGFGYKSGFLLF